MYYSADEPGGQLGIIVVAKKRYQILLFKLVFIICRRVGGGWHLVKVHYYSLSSVFSVMLITVTLIWSITFDFP